MNKTKIEYLDYSWSPIAMRCTPISEGCTNCWHRRMAKRLAGNTAFPLGVRLAYAGEGPPVLVAERLMEPVKRKKAARIGVQFMGDLYNDIVPWEFILWVYKIIKDTPQHTYQILTKRPKRMLALQPHIWGELPNVWLGVSVENQATADERREYLRQTPATVKFVSYEPALAPIDWTGWEFVDQIISGGESGPKARPSHPDWHRATRDFCQQHGIAYFMKQWGAWAHIPSDVRYPLPQKLHWWPDRNLMGRVGKKRAGRLLDGQLWEEYPR